MSVETPRRPAILLPYPHAGQQVVRASARRFNWLAAGRRWRKTTLAMAVAVEAALEGQRILWGAPVFDQIFVGWTEARKAVAGIAMANQSRMSLTFPGGGQIIYRSLDNPDNARGHTADGVVIDEAADVSADAWHEVVRPMLMDTGGWAWLLGTPKGRNYFWEGLNDAESAPDSCAWRIPTLGCVVENGRLYRRPHPLENPHIRFEELERLHATMPESAFRQEILAEFVSGIYDTFEPDWWLDRRYDAGDPRHVNACVARWISWDTGFKDVDKDKPNSDPAYTACVVAELTRDYRLFIREVWRDRVTFPNLIARMEQMARRYNVDGKLRGVIIEDKASGISALQTIRETGEPWLADLVEPFAPQGSKEQRAELAAVWCKQGCVWLPHPSEGVPWLYEFERELLGFPATTYKDQVDAFSQLILYTSRWLSVGRDLRAEAARQVDATLMKEDAA